MIYDCFQLTDELKLFLFKLIFDPVVIPYLPINIWKKINNNNVIKQHESRNFDPTSLRCIRSGHF